MAKNENNSASRGLIYIRKSSPGEGFGPKGQYAWAVKEAQKLGVKVDATTETLDSLMAQSGGSQGDLYVDIGETGNNLSRPAFDAMYKRAMNDAAVTHVFIHMRDRFARPEFTAPAMKLENDLLLAGKTVVFSDRVMNPRRRGENYMAEDVQMLLDYAQSGQHLNIMADKVVRALEAAAKEGRWCGGRAPYGFVRVFIGPDGNVVRKLADGERARQPGHHVEIQPGDPDKIRTWIQMLTWYHEERWGELHRQ